MSSMLEVPAEMVGYLRSALHSAIQPPVEGIAEVVDRPDREQHPEWYLKHFVQLYLLAVTPSMISAIGVLSGSATR
jgi:hypothetical protein